VRRSPAFFCAEASPNLTLPSFAATRFVQNGGNRFSAGAGLLSRFSVFRSRTAIPVEMTELLNVSVGLKAYRFPRPHSSFLGRFDLFPWP